MTTVATTFTIWSNRASALVNPNTSLLYGAGQDQNDNHQRRSCADARYELPQFARSIVLGTRLWSQNLGFYGDWLTQFNRPPTIALNTADGSTSTSSTPTLEFTGTDLDGDDCSYQIQLFSNRSVQDSYSETNIDTSSAFSTTQSAVGQSFHGTDAIIVSAKFYMRKNGTVTGFARAKLYAHTGTFGSSSKPAGTALCTSTDVDVSTLPTVLGLVEFPFANGYTMVSGTDYCIVLECLGQTGTFPNQVIVGSDTSTPAHAGNHCFTIDNVTWSAQTNEDTIFYVYGVSSSALLDKRSSADAGFANTVTGGDTDPFNQGEKASFTVQAGDALTNGTYQWRVCAIDSAGNTGDWSVFRSLTIAVSAFSETTGSVSGTGTLTGISGARDGVVASTNGTVSVSGVTSAIWDSVSSSIGTSTISGAATAIWDVPGTIAGNTTISGVASAIWRELASATGQASLTGTVLAISVTQGTISSLATIQGSGEAVLSGFSFSAASGSFTLSGQDAALHRAYSTSGGSGAFSFSGNALVLYRGRRLNAGTQSFALSGQSTGLYRGHTLSCAVTAFILSGKVAGLFSQPRLIGGAGSFSLSGQSANLVIPGRMQADRGTFALSGQSVIFPRHLSFSLAAGGITLNGQTATFLYQPRVLCSFGHFIFSAHDADVHPSTRFPLERGNFIFYGFDTVLSYEEVAYIGEIAIGVAGGSRVFTTSGIDTEISTVMELGARRG